MLKRYSESKESLHDSVRLNNDDNALMQALLDKHPNVTEKVGDGVDHIYVSGFHRVTWCDTFFIKRIDGSSDPLGYNKCFTGKTPKQDVYEALRAAVAGQINRYREDALRDNPVCPYLGIRLERGNNHVDHVSPNTFQSLVDVFLHEEHLQWFDLALTPSHTYHHCAPLADKGVERRWQQYHEDHAVLRLLSVKANLSDSKLDRQQEISNIS